MFESWLKKFAFEETPTPDEDDEDEDELVSSFLSAGGDADADPNFFATDDVVLDVAFVPFVLAVAGVAVAVVVLELSPPNGVRVAENPLGLKEDDFAPVEDELDSVGDLTADVDDLFSPFNFSNTFCQIFNCCW